MGFTDREKFHVSHWSGKKQRRWRNTKLRARAIVLLRNQLTIIRSVHTSIYIYIYTGKRTEWSPIRSVIIRLIIKSDDRQAWHRIETWRFAPLGTRRGALLRIGANGKIENRKKSMCNKTCQGTCISIQEGKIYLDSKRSRIYCTPFYFTREYITVVCSFYIILTKLYPYFKMELVSLFYLAILVIFKSSNVISNFLISVEGAITVQVSSGLTQVPGDPDELWR